MRVIVIRQLGDPSQPKTEEAPTPEPRGDEVLVEVKAALINPSDVKNVMGAMHGTTRMPAVKKKVRQCRSRCRTAILVNLIGPQVNILVTLIIISFWMAAVGTCATTVALTPSADAEAARDLLRRVQRITENAGGTGESAELMVALAAVGDARAAERLLQSFPLSDRYGDVTLRRLATGYARGGDLEQARKVIARIRDSDKAYARQRPLAWLFSGRALAVAGRKTEAAEALEEAVRAVAHKNEPPSELDGQFLAEVAENQYALGQVSVAIATFDRAVSEAGADPDVRLWHIGLSNIAAIQTKVGLLGHAIRTAQRIGNPDERDLAWLQIIEALTSAGQLDEARRLVDTNNVGWLTLANAYAKAGHPEEARRAIKKMEVKAKTATDEEAQIALAQHLGESYGLAGDTNAASEWLERAAALAQRATIVANGPFAVLRSIEKVPGAAHRQRALREIAASQAKVGLRDAARRTFQDAKNVAQGEQPGMWGNTAIAVIAEAQAQAGMPGDAVTTLEGLPKEYWSYSAWVAVALAKLRNGNLEDSLSVADAHGGAPIRTDIAAALMNMGNTEEAVRIGLTGAFPEVLRPAAYRLALVGRKKFVITATDSANSTGAQTALLLGAAEGLLDRTVPHPDARVWYNAWLQFSLRRLARLIRGGQRGTNLHSLRWFRATSAVVKLWRDALLGTLRLCGGGGKFVALCSGTGRSLDCQLLGRADT